MNKTLERDPFFDNAKFILIVLVVIGHSIRPFINDNPFLGTIYNFLYSFHMPLFIMISGYFSKNFKRESYYRNAITRLLIPYLIFQTLYTLIDTFIYNPSSKLDFSLLTPYWSLWFLISLFFWRMLLPLFVQLKYPLLWAIAIGVLVGYFDDVGKFMSLSRTFVFFPFYLAGYYIQREHIRKLFTPWIRTTSITLFLFLFALFYFLLEIAQIPIDLDILRRSLYGSYSYGALYQLEWYAGLYRLLLYGISAFLSITFLSFIPRQQTFFTDMGQRTLYVYLLHGLVVRTLIAFGVDEKITTPLEQSFVILFAVLVGVLLATRSVQKIARPFVEPRIYWLFDRKS